MVNYVHLTIGYLPDTFAKGQYNRIWSYLSFQSGGENIYAAFTEVKVPNG